MFMTKDGVSLEEARRMPSEIRRWWIKERIKQSKEHPGTNSK